MKHLKLFEKKKEGFYLLIKMYEGLPESYWLFNDEHQKNLFLIQLIHKMESNGDYNSDYKCKNIVDPYELLEYWNEKSSDNGNEIYDEYVKVTENFKIDSDLKIKLDAKKFNI